MTELAPQEQLNLLVEEITAIIASRKFNVGLEHLQMRHEIGRAVLDHPLYEKNKRGQGQLIQTIAAQVGLQERSLRYCLEFAVKYPDFEEVIQKADPNHKMPVWRDIVRELPSGRREEKEVEPKCKHCFHCPQA